MNKSTQYDLIVAGLGTAGMIAAITAAERGLRVLAIEQNSYPGGTFTGGFITGFYQQPGAGKIVEMVQTAQEKKDKKHFFGLVEVLKQVIEQRAKEAKVELLYETRVVGAIVEADKIVGVTWKSLDDQSGCAYAPVVIDATAEATVCRYAGCPLLGGRASDGKFQPYTHSYLFSHPDHLWCSAHDAGYVNQLDNKDFTQKYLTSATLYAFDDYTQDHRPTIPADLPGIREGMHIQTDDMPTLAAALNCEFHTDEPVFYAYTNVDTHAQDLALESETMQDWLLGASMWGPNLWFAVPRSCMFPQKISGLIVAGRHLGVDHDLGHALRMNALMAGLGEAAAVIASKAREQQIAPDQVTYSSIVSELNLPASPLAENAAIFALSDAEILAGLASDRPGFAMWSARTRKRLELVKDAWHKAKITGSSNLSRHAAMTLALMGDASGKEDLQQMVRERDPYQPSTGRKNNYARGFVAVYLLGRLRDVSALDLLIDVLCDNSIQDKFRYHTQAIRALVDIISVHVEQRPRIAKFLKDYLANPDLELSCPLHFVLQNIERRYEQAFRNYVANKLAEF